MVLHKKVYHNRSILLLESSENTFMARVKSENAITRELDYKLIRRLISEDGDYSSNIADDFDKTSGVISEYLSNLREIDLVEKQREGQKVMYYANIEGLHNQQAQMLNFEDIPPEFLENYIQLYASFHTSSTIRKMLRDDFVTIFSAYSKFKDVPVFLEEFLETPEAEAFDSRHMEIAETVLGDSGV